MEGTPVFSLFSTHVLAAPYRGSTGITTATKRENTRQAREKGGHRVQVPALHEPVFSKAESAPAANNDVIQYPHVHQRQSLFEALSKRHIGRAGLE